MMFWQSKQAAESSTACSESSWAESLEDLDQGKRTIDLGSQSTSLWSASSPLSCTTRIRIVVSSFEFQLGILLLLLVDACIILHELVLVMQGRLDDDDFASQARRIVGWILYCIFLLEVIGKLIAFGVRNFCRDPWNVFDTVVLVASILFAEIILARLARAAKIVRLVLRCVRFGRLCQVGGTGVVKAARQRVSKNKSRFVDVEDNIDLDLTYISSDLIAMGVPCVHPIISLYRNPLSQVVRFFEIKHKESFRIYNACPELPYPAERFEAAGGTVVALQIQDHTPPTMVQFVQFLRDAQEFLHGLPGGIIAVHCKGGKGRTGSLCAAWLLYCKRAASAKAALKLFAKKRTDLYRGKALCGVETPSQVRYVQQMARHLERTATYLSSPQPVSFCLNPAINLQVLNLEGGLIAKPHKTKPLRVLVQCGGANTSDLVLETPSFSSDSLSVPLQGVVVQGDVRISLFQDKGAGFNAHKAMTSVPNAHQAKGLVLLFLFHTAFMDMDDNDGNSPDESSKVTEGNGRYRVSIANLDKANRRVKKGVHLSTSSVSLSYGFTDISGVVQDPRGQPVGSDFSGGALRESGTVASMQPGQSACTDGEDVERCSTEQPQFEKVEDVLSTTREHMICEKQPAAPCDEKWLDDCWLHIAPPGEGHNWEGADCTIQFGSATKLPTPLQHTSKNWAEAAVTDVFNDK